MIDFRSPDFHNDPYPALAELRAHGRPVWHEETGMFLAARHADANAVLRDKSLGRIFQPRTPDNDWFDFNWLHADSILDSEPPKHTRLKSLISKAFNPTTIRALQPDIERLANGLLDSAEAQLADGGEFDLIGDLAEPLPVKVIAFMLGFPEEDEHLLRPWSQAIVKMYEVSPTEQHKIEARAAAHDFAEYVHALMVERKANPGHDLISVLSAVEDDGRTLSTHELIATCVLLLNAGHEASVNGLGNGAVAALERPDTVKALRDDPRPDAKQCAIRKRQGRPNIVDRGGFGFQLGKADPCRSALGDKRHRLRARIVTVFIVRVLLVDDFLVQEGRATADGANLDDNIAPYQAK